MMALHLEHILRQLLEASPRCGREGLRVQQAQLPDAVESEHACNRVGVHVGVAVHMEALPQASLEEDTKSSAELDHMESSPGGERSVGRAGQGGANGCRGHLTGCHQQPGGRAGGSTLHAVKHL